MSTVMPDATTKLKQYEKIINSTYIQDTSELRRNVEKTYKTFFPEYSYSISIRTDNEWSAYKDFLYPNDLTLEYMGNQSVVDKLIEQGDNLKKSRQVDHYLYFYTRKESQAFAEYAKTLSFNIEGIERIKNDKMPFQVHMSRSDYVDIESITKITFQLRADAKKYNGVYDGWETYIIED